MKIFTLLFALYVLVLSMTPCQAAHCRHEHHATEPQDHEEDHDDSDGHEVCSPFCVCSACAGFVANEIHAPHLQPSGAFFNVAQNDFLPIADLPEVYLRVFQPPKI